MAPHHSHGATLCCQHECLVIESDTTQLKSANYRAFKKPMKTTINNERNYENSKLNKKKKPHIVSLINRDNKEINHAQHHS